MNSGWIVGGYVSYRWVVVKKWVGVGYSGLVWLFLAWSGNFGLEQLLLSTIILAKTVFFCPTKIAKKKSVIFVLFSNFKSINTI